MADFQETVKKYISLGLSIIPLGANKAPTTAWKQFMGKCMSDAQIVRHFAQDKAVGVGLVCGNVSGFLTAIDVDCKYDLTGRLFEDYKSRIPVEIFNKLVIQKTVNYGYHLIFRCKKVESNQKLAQRDATDDEKIKGEKIKVLIETRGEGGFIAIYPTSGYSFIQKNLNEISEISEDEYQTLLDTAKEFNEVFKENQIIFHSKPTNGEESPLQAYNDSGNVFALLVKHGWKIIEDTNERMLFRRPGKQDGHSASFNKQRKWFYVFSSSTEFEQHKAYLPYAVYAMLECNGSFSEAAKKLLADGYGQQRIQIKTKSNQIQENVTSFISPEEDDMAYFLAAKDGTLPMGLCTGMKTLDDHYRFKQGNFVVINGIDNTGKTLAMLFLSVMSAIKHKWSWIIYAGENRSVYIKRKLIELYYCKPITDLTKEQIEIGYIWVKNHYTLIDNNEIYTYKNILEIGKHLFEEKEYQAFLVDPYNSLYIEMDTFSKLSTHDYHYLATSEFRLFCKKYNCSIYLNCHAVTEALRKTFQKGHQYEGFPMPPGKADTEGGGKFSNRADDFITIHRHVQHDTDWMWTEFHVRKIKETETGGRPTGLDSPVKIKIVRGNCGFEDVNGYNPITDTYTPTIQYSITSKEEKDEPYAYPF